MAVTCGYTDLIEIIPGSEETLEPLERQQGKHLVEQWGDAAQGPDEEHVIQVLDKNGGLLMAIESTKRLSQKDLSWIGH